MSNIYYQYFKKKLNNKILIIKKLYSQNLIYIQIFKIIFYKTYINYINSIYKFTLYEILKISHAVSVEN